MPERRRDHPASYHAKLGRRDRLGPDNQKNRTSKDESEATLLEC